MKKLAILINSMNGGGAEHVVSILLEELIKKYEVHLVVLHAGVAYKIPNEVKLHHLAISSLDAPDYKKVVHLPLLAYRYYRFCQKNEIDISLSLLNRSNYINILSRYLGAKHRTIISERASTVEVYPKNNLRGKFSRMLIKWLYPKADTIITISKGIEIDLIKIFNINPKKIQTIYNPIDLDHLQTQLGRVLDKKNKEFTFIAIGRLHKQKNYPLLLKAFAKLHLPAKLIILGEGPLRKELQELIADLNIENKVAMPGFVTDIVPYLKNADCFVLPSNYEGFGNVIIEALGCGKAVISTDCYHGPSEILADRISSANNQVEYAKYGILVPLNDSDALAQAMNEMVLNENHRHSYELLGPQRANDFNKNIIFNQYLHVLEGVNLSI